MVLPDDGFAAAIVPVNSAEHFATFAANDNLCKAVVAAVGALFAIGTGFDHSPAYQLFLHPQEDVLWNDCFVVALHIILRNNAIVLDSGFIQEVCGVGLLKKDITDVYQFPFLARSRRSIASSVGVSPLYSVAQFSFTI